MPTVIHKRGTRAQIDAAAAAGSLRNGEIYLITDEARLTVGTDNNAHQPVCKQGEGQADPWTWQKLSADVVNSTVTLAPVPGMMFDAEPDTTYLVEILGAYQSVINTTGLALVLDIPSGSVIGQAVAVVTGTTPGMIEQFADGVSSGATPATRAPNSNTALSARYLVNVGSAGGPVQLMFRSEIAGSAITIKAHLTVMGMRKI
jgi:hypothetical protein